MSPASPHVTRAWVEIDLPAIDRNVGRIKQALPAHVRYVAVVKANAYGHGMPEIATRLLQAGVDCFAVANVGEAVRLREIGHDADILLLSPTLPSEMLRAVALDLEVTLNSVAEAEALERCAAAAERKVRVHIKVDTGMGRAGVWHTEARGLIGFVRAAQHLDWRGLYTHFSEADADTDFTAEQRRIFLALLAEVPVDERARLLIHVVKDLPAGTAVSYNRTKVLTRDSRVAIVAVGYGDGVPTAASNRGCFLVRGRRCPILGRVTMDQTIVDVTDLPEVAVGDIATILGAQGGERITVGEFCAWSDCIPWEALCTLTQRVQRVYRTDRT